MILAKRGGVVDQVDSERIIVRVEGGEEGGGKEFGADIYPLTKFRRSNQNTCINQKPIVAEGTGSRGERSSPTDRARPTASWRSEETSSSRSCRGAATTTRTRSWCRRGSSRTTSSPRSTSRSSTSKPGTPSSGRRRSRGTSPTSSENALRDLDESGIIRIGATVKPGDILVGKVTPKGETQLTPEEKLLRAIFGEKAGDVRDASLKCPPGIEGTVVDVKIFSRKGVDKDLRAKSIEEGEIERIEKNSRTRSGSSRGRQQEDRGLLGDKKLSPTRSTSRRATRLVGKGEHG